MRRNSIGWVALGAIVAFASLPGAKAGDRPTLEKGKASRALAELAQAQPNFHPATARLQGGTAPQYSFSPVSPFASKSAGNAPASRSAAADRTRQAGPATTPTERKPITFFRLDPKFGDVSLRPVVGGVNGAQVSLGF